jgi:hypothetical protein
MSVGITSAPRARYFSFMRTLPSQVIALWGLLLTTSRFHLGLNVFILTTALSVRAGFGVTQSCGSLHQRFDHRYVAMALVVHSFLMAVVG